MLSLTVLELWQAIGGSLATLDALLAPIMVLLAALLRVTLTRGEV